MNNLRRAVTTAVLSFPEGYLQNSHYSLVYCLSFGLVSKALYSGIGKGHQQVGRATMTVI